MKHYEKIIELGCFSRQTLAKLLGSDSNAASTIQDYLRRGLIERIRHDLYAVMSLETLQPIPSRYQIATALFPDAYISHHSAFEFYGCANQVFYEVYVSTSSRFKDFTYGGITYRRVNPKQNATVKKFGSVRVSSLEQTVVESINDFEKIGGLEETIRCLLIVPSLNETKLLNILGNYNCGFLYQKVGYLLYELNDTLNLSASFFEECKKHLARSKRYFYKGGENFVWNSQWGIYTPTSVYGYKT